MKHIIAEYKRYRKKGMDLNGKLFKELKRSDIKNAARLLGLLKKETLVMDSEEEMDRFTDFAINDYHSADSKTAVQRYKEKNCFAQKNTEEEKILEALLISKPSLYKVNGVNTKTSTVYLSDVLNEGNEIEIIDIGFSTHAAINNFLLFTRIVSIDKIKSNRSAPYKVTDIDSDQGVFRRTRSFGGSVYYERKFNKNLWKWLKHVIMWKWLKHVIMWKWLKHVIIGAING